MKLFGMILVAAMAAPSVFAYDSKATTTGKPAAETTATKINTWALAGVTAANKQAIIDAVTKATGATKVTLTDAGALTVEGNADATKIVAALPSGVTVKK